MNEVEGYAVFFFPQALEALGEAIKPYLADGPAGPYLLCREIDTGGSLIEMTLADGGSDRAMGRELMVPTSMVRMIVSARADEAFGFGPRPSAAVASGAVPPAATPANGPVVAPVAPRVAELAAQPAAQPVAQPAAQPVPGPAVAPAADAPAASSTALLTQGPTTR